MYFFTLVIKNQDLPFLICRIYVAAQDHVRGFLHCQVNRDSLLCIAIFLAIQEVCIINWCCYRYPKYEKLCICTREQWDICDISSIVLVKCNSAVANGFNSVNRVVAELRRKVEVQDSDREYMSRFILVCIWPDDSVHIHLTVCFCFRPGAIHLLVHWVIPLSYIARFYM
jgi:hypothetical protein